jgi:hypothetical protein
MDGLVCITNTIGVFRAKKNGIDLAIEQVKGNKTVKCKDFNDYLQKVK